MLDKLYNYFDTHRGIIRIFLVYFFLTFVIGYLDFDRRVLTFVQSFEKLQDIVEKRMPPPIGRRVLIPYVVYFTHKALQIPLKYTYAFYRFVFFLLADANYSFFCQQ